MLRKTEESFRDWVDEQVRKQNEVAEEAAWQGVEQVWCFTVSIRIGAKSPSILTAKDLL